MVQSASILYMRPRGFTLIELLVVIAIIGLLSSVVLSSLNAARMKARDAQRKSDVKQLAIALELDYDKYGSYTQPENMCTDTSYGSFDTCGGAGGTGDWDSNSDLRDLVTHGFMSKLPLDPLNNATYYYTYEAKNAGEAGLTRAGEGYSFCAKLEASGGSYCVSRP